MANFYGSLIGFGAGGGPVFTVATGGDTDGAISGDYKVHIFNNSGTFEITTLGADAVVEYLIIAGGGGGGGGTGGLAGGGGGGHNSGAGAAGGS